MFQLVDILRFYKIFEIKDLSDGGKTKTYQAVVLLEVHYKITLTFFKLIPSEDAKTYNHGKELF